MRTGHLQRSSVRTAPRTPLHVRRVLQGQHQKLKAVAGCCLNARWIPQHPGKGRNRAIPGIRETRVMMNVGTSNDVELFAYSLSRPIRDAHILSNLKAAQPDAAQECERARYRILVPPQRLAGRQRQSICAYGVRVEQPPQPRSLASTVDSLSVQATYSEASKSALAVHIPLVAEEVTLAARR
jgi:hypothetical protein